jgi:hypothetical protein
MGLLVQIISSYAMGPEVKALSNRAAFAGGNQLISEFFITVFWTSPALSNKDEYTKKYDENPTKLNSKRLSDTNLNRRQSRGTGNRKQAISVLCG